LVKLRDIVVKENEVSFGAGCIYSDLLVAVDTANKALPNLPSLPHINVVGSMVTTTHGSGYKQPALIAHVQNFDIVMGDGSLQTVRKDDPNFYLYIHSFGGAGIITRMSMTVVPRFHIYKSIYRHLSWDAIKDDAVFD
jgi:alditol oxidase